jgi:hypothetical protein
MRRGAKPVGKLRRAGKSVVGITGGRLMMRIKSATLLMCERMKYVKRRKQRDEEHLITTNI